MGTICCVSFSPTGTSKDVACQIARELEGEKTIVDLCEAPAKDIQFGRNDLCIFSVPCYGGRIPQTAAARLSRLHGDATAAIVCVTFGNRAFEDALLELADTVEAQGFAVFAGAAVAAEHTIMHIFGQGRPDAADREEIAAFARQAARKHCAGDSARPALPGNRPYRAWHGGSTPILVKEATCNHCGLCAQRCPVDAISPDGSRTDAGQCIGCMRCIQQCPTASRSLPAEHVAALIARLGPACEGRKANAFYL